MEGCGGVEDRKSSTLSELPSLYGHKLSEGVCGECASGHALTIAGVAFDGEVYGPGTVNRGFYVKPEFSDESVPGKGRLVQGQPFDGRFGVAVKDVLPKLPVN